MSDRPGGLPLQPQGDSTASTHCLSTLPCWGREPTIENAKARRGENAKRARGVGSASSFFRVLAPSRFRVLSLRRRARVTLHLAPSGLVQGVHCVQTVFE